MEHADLYEKRANSFAYQKNLEIRKQVFKMKIIPKLKAWNIFLPGAKLVEIGCGQGDKSDIIARNLTGNSSLISIEVSQEMIDTAKRRYPRLGANIIRDDALTLNKLSGKHDVFFYLDVLQHFSPEQIKMAISKAVSKLSDNGKIITINTFVPEKGLMSKYFSWSSFIYETLFRIKSGSYKNLKVSEVREIFDEFGLKLTGRHFAGLTAQVLCFSK